MRYTFSQTVRRSSVAVIAFTSFSATLFLPALAVAAKSGSETETCSQRAVINFASATLFKTLQSAGGATKITILGFKLPDIFPEITYDHSLDFWTCVNSLLEKAAEVALERFRKRLLDRLTDDIVAWVSDGRDPKFITNFGDYLEEATQVAVGDTAREIGLADLCTPFKARIPPLLKPIPKFSQSVSCTLDDIVGNIEGFYEDFSRGGPLAYAESFSPNNNLVGILFATKDELIRKKDEEEKKAQLAATASGYRPVEQCVEWTISGTRRSDGKFVALIAIPDGVNLTNHPYLPPGPGSAPYENAANTIDNPQFSCTKKEITLPPAGTGQIASVALTADTQYLTNTDDLSPYINAIFDAATNRIIKEGVKGLRGSLSNLQSESGTGRTPRSYRDDDRYRNYGSEYATSTNSVTQLRSKLRTLIAQTRIDVASASTTLARLTASNQDLITTSTALANCEISRDLDNDPSVSNTCQNTSSTLASAHTRHIQLTIDHENLSNALATIADTESWFNTNPTAGEEEFRARVSVLITLQSYIASVRTQWNTLEPQINQTRTDIGKKLQACQTSSYSCSWTPSN